MQSFFILQMGRGSALNKRLFASFLLYQLNDILNHLSSQNVSTNFLYPATKVWRGIMLYLSVSVRLSIRPSMLTISDR